MTLNISCIASTKSLVGEGAFWDDRAQVLWWLDIPAGIIYKYDPLIGENREFKFGEPVGCLAVCETGGLVLAAKSGFWFFDPDTGNREAICDPESHLESNRFNDGATDAQGRFWAGTMKEGDNKEPAGSFYRLDADLSVTRWKEGFHTTNGLAFSPEGSRMYFSDSNPNIRKIWVCDYDQETGTPYEPALFFDTSKVPGRPDGGTVDSEGCYWQAGVGGWQLYRLSPRGEILMTIDMPVEKPTKPMFGGAGLDTLFVTSIGAGLTNNTDQPEAGSLFSINGLDVKGLPQKRFAA